MLASDGVTSSPTFSKLLVIALVAIFVLASVAFLVAASSARPDGTATPAATGGPGSVSGGPAAGRAVALAQASPEPAISPAASAQPAESIDPAASVDPAASLDPFVSPDPLASPLPLTDPAAIVELRMPMVPVVGFWGTTNSVGRDGLISALRGQSTRWDRVLVPAADRAAIEAALGITIASSVQSLEPAQIERAVRKERVLGILRASDVTHRLRAVGIDGVQLFGNDRLRNLDNWPLVATVQGPAGTAWDQRDTWTLVAGGDSFTDRGIHERVVNRGKGIDYPFDGGRARVTGHYCCGPFVPGNKVPRYVLSGPKGIVRDMTRDADLAIVNHESPIPNDWDFHLHGFVFSGKPALTEIFVRAGIDWMSLANNHIKDYGTDGVIDTRRNLDKWGIKYGGAGKDLKQARQFEVLEVKGVRIAIIPCTAVASYSMASRNSGGATPCRDRFVVPDIRRAREQADVVIVFPHWGAEYIRTASGVQRGQAQSWVDAGADLILGAHSHVAGAIEEIGDAPVFYSLGNFIFDQNWATYTMESFLLELTFHGDRIVQMRLHPFLSHDQAQPNFLNPAKDDGRALLRAVRRASYIDW